MLQPHLLAHYSFLIPAKKYFVNFDITTSKPFSAFLELSIYLLDTLKIISANELQSFFGIDTNECDSLIQQILSYDVGFINDNGDLEITCKIEELRKPDGSLRVEEHEPKSDWFIVDLATCHIQPKPSSFGNGGFHELIPENFNKDLSIETIFKDDFSRVKIFSNYQYLRDSKTRLYRINDCTYDSLTMFPVSINIFSKLQPDGHLQLMRQLSGFSNDDIELVENSGILRYLNDKLNSNSDYQYCLSPSDYCNLVLDNVLPDFFSESDIFDIEKYLLARDKKKTGYNAPKTTGLLGAIYLPKNRNRLVGWLKNVSKIQPIFWMPASSSYWGASTHAKQFYDELHELLPQKDSMLSLILPKPRTKQSSYRLKKRFSSFVDAIHCVPSCDALNEMEIMIVPGYPCWAMVQYHAKLHQRFDLGDIRIPIGYITYDPNRVKHLWSIFINKFNISKTTILETLYQKNDAFPDIFEYLINSHNWHTDDDNNEIDL